MKTWIFTLVLFFSLVISVYFLVIEFEYLSLIHRSFYLLLSSVVPATILTYVGYHYVKKYHFGTERLRYTGMIFVYLLFVSAGLLLTINRKTSNNCSTESCDIISFKGQFVSPRGMVDESAVANRFEMVLRTSEGKIETYVLRQNPFGSVVSKSLNVTFCTSILGYKMLDVNSLN